MTPEAGSAEEEVNGSRQHKWHRLEPKEPKEVSHSKHQEASEKASNHMFRA